MIRPYLVVTILLTFLFSCAITPVDNEKKVVFNSKAYVHKVMSVLGGHCSSVYVNYKNKVRHITNAHCCENPLLLDGKELKFVKIDVPNDLCELSHDNIPSRGVKYVI